MAEPGGHTSCWCHSAFRRSKSITKPNFVDICQLTASIFEKKQMSAILEIYFRFRFRPFVRNLDIILHQATEFRPNRSTHCGNMTLYRFLKIAAATAEYYFRFRIWWCHCLQQTKFCGDISIGGWDITTSGFEIQTSAILEFYFWFRSRPVRRDLHVILHEATEFRPNRSTHCENMTSYPFLNMAAATAKYYFRFRIC